MRGMRRGNDKECAKVAELPLELGEPLGGEGLACGWSESGIGNECLSASSPVAYPVNVDIEAVKKVKAE